MLLPNRGNIDGVRRVYEGGSKVGKNFIHNLIFISYLYTPEYGVYRSSFKLNNKVLNSRGRAVEAPRQNPRSREPPPKKHTKWILRGGMYFKVSLAKKLHPNATSPRTAPGPSEQSPLLKAEAVAQNVPLEINT